MYIKWWMIMAQAHDGSYVVLPGRDYASTDHVYGTRNFPTACAALILSLKERRLRITGWTPGGAEGMADKPREPRVLLDENAPLLGRTLLTTLAELSHAGAITPTPINLSKANGQVAFVRVERDGKLAFRAMGGGTEASYPLDALSAADHAQLGRLIAKLRADDPEAQALAGILMELSGHTELADKYYEALPEPLKNKLSDLFE